MHGCTLAMSSLYPSGFFDSCGRKLVPPIAYPSSVLPDGWRLIYSLNPKVGVVDGIRWSLFGTPLHASALLTSIAATLLATSCLR